MSVSEQQCRLPYFSRTDSEGQASVRAIGNKRRIKVQIGAPKCRKLWGFLLIFHCNFVIPMANTQESSTAFSRLSRQVYLQVVAVIWQVFSLFFAGFFRKFQKGCLLHMMLQKETCQIASLWNYQVLSSLVGKFFLSCCCSAFDKFFCLFFYRIFLQISCRLNIMLSYCNTVRARS